MSLATWEAASGCAETSKPSSSDTTAAPWLTVVHHRALNLSQIRSEHGKMHQLLMMDFVELVLVPLLLLPLRPDRSR